MNTALQQALLIGLGVGVAGIFLKRLRRGRTPPESRAPAWAALCRVLLLLGCVLFYAVPLAALAVCYALAPHLVVLAAAGLVVYQFRRSAFRPGTAHGSAREADHGDLLASGAFDLKPGLLLGQFPPPTRREAFRLLRKAPPHAALGAVRVFLAALARRPLWVRLQKIVHVGIFCPTGGGKTSAFSIPHILTDDDSAVVIDPSSEIYAATRQSRRARGHRIVVLDPAGLTGVESDSLNPMAGMDPADPEFLDTCRALGDAVVVRSGLETDPHWIESSALYISAIIGSVVFVTHRTKRPDLCNLQRVSVR